MNVLLLYNILQLSVLIKKLHSPDSRFLLIKVELFIDLYDV